MRATTEHIDSTAPAPGTAVSFPGLPLPQRHRSMAAIWIAMTMAVLDGVIANIALPTIADGFHADPSASIWVINAYQIAIIMLLLPAAAMGEILGHRRVYLGGVIVFVAASAGCCFATSLHSLSAWRFVQGIGAAAVMAVNGALIRLTYPSSSLGRGLSYNSVIVAVSSAAGPSVAAAVLAWSSWHWLFAVNVPIGLVALAIGWKALPTNRRSTRPFEWRSALSSALSLGALFLAVEDVVAGRFGWATGACTLIAVAGGAALLRSSRRTSEPLVPLDLLRIRSLASSYVLSIGIFAAQTLSLVALPFYLESRFGDSHLTIGLLFTAFPLGVLLGAPLSGRLSDRMAAAPLCTAGLALFTVGFGLLASVGAPPHALIAAFLLLAGLGFGIFQAPNNRVMLAGAPHQRIGAAAGMMAVSRLLGQISGALAAALLLRLQGTASAWPFLLTAGIGLLAAAAAYRSAPARQVARGGA